MGRGCGMSRFIIPILCTLCDKEAYSDCDAMSVNEILLSELCCLYSYSGIYKSCQDLMQAGLITYGLQDGNAYTYYLTEKGKQYCKDRKLVD